MTFDAAKPKAAHALAHVRRYKYGEVDTLVKMTKWARESDEPWLTVI